MAGLLIDTSLRMTEFRHWVLTKLLAEVFACSGALMAANYFQYGSLFDSFFAELYWSAVIALFGIVVSGFIAIPAIALSLNAEGFRNVTGASAYVVFCILPLLFSALCLIFEGVNHLTIAFLSGVPLVNILFLLRYLTRKSV